jgi:hypothetical protein
VFVAAADAGSPATAALVEAVSGALGAGARVVIQAHAGSPPTDDALEAAARARGAGAAARLVWDRAGGDAGRAGRVPGRQRPDGAPGAGFRAAGPAGRAGPRRRSCAGIPAATASCCRRCGPGMPGRRPRCTTGRHRWSSARFDGCSGRGTWIRRTWSSRRWCGSCSPSIATGATAPWTPGPPPSRPTPSTSTCATVRSSGACSARPHHRRRPVQGLLRELPRRERPGRGDHAPDRQ